MGDSAFIRRTRYWRAGCTETCPSGSGGGGWIPLATRGWPPTSYETAHFVGDQITCGRGAEIAVAGGRPRSHVIWRGDRPPTRGTHHAPARGPLRRLAARGRPRPARNGSAQAHHAAGQRPGRGCLLQPGRPTARGRRGRG